MTDQNFIEDDNKTDSEYQKVDPWTVESSVSIDYDRLIKKFGTMPLDESIIERMESLTGVSVHPWIKDGFIYSHRDFNKILDMYEAGELFYLYTGRGPSSESLHLGHLVPFKFTKWLQDVFNVPVVIQCTDDEKFLWKNITLADTQRFMRSNVRDIIALGFDPKRTFIFSDMDYIGSMYYNIVNIQKHITVNQAKSCFGFTDSNNIGQIGFAAIQAAPAFSSSFPDIFGKDSNIPCLIPCAIDQDPYFRLARDVAPKLGLKKPALIHSKFFPALKGTHGKMSASESISSIFLTDTPKQIRRKIMKYAFSGGGATAIDQREYGANLEVDISYQYLRFFCPDQTKVREIGQKYARGELLTGEVKNILVDVLVNMVQEHQRIRSTITDDMVNNFMCSHKINT